MLLLAFYLRKVDTQWFYYLLIKDVGKLRGRKNGGDTREKKPQVPVETGPTGIPVVSQGRLNTTPILCTEGAFLLPES